MNICWTEDAWKEYIEWQIQDKKILKKINELIKDIQRNGNEGLGSPEPLRHQLSGFWSRRITIEHRLIYKITEDTIVILACAKHYK